MAAALSALIQILVPALKFLEKSSQKFKTPIYIYIRCFPPLVCITQPESSGWICPYFHLSKFPWSQEKEQSFLFHFHNSLKHVTSAWNMLYFTKIIRTLQLWNAFNFFHAPGSLVIPDSGHSTLPYPKAVSIISNVPLTLGNLKRSSCRRNSEICINLAPFRFSQGTRRSKTSVFSRNTCRPLGVF